MHKGQLKVGAMFSYVLIVINTLYGIFFTPFLLSQLGSGEYGVYKIISSLVSSLSILDLGIGGTVLRYVSEYHARKEKKAIENFAAMGLIEASLIGAGIVAVCTIAYCGIDITYAESLSAFELQRAKQLFKLFALALVLHTYEKVVFSLIAGHEYFGFANGVKLVRLLFKIAISLLLLLRFQNSVVLLLAELICTLASIFAYLIFLYKKIGMRIHLYTWDWSLFRASGQYTALAFIQSLVVQLNGNIDNMVIGAVEGASAVSVYSIGLQLYGMYESFAMAFSDLMLPTVSRQIAAKSSNRELENTIIKVGRLEFIMLGAALCGFLCIGKEFIRLWLGENYLFSWTVGVLLMIPTTIPLVQNVSLSVLRAQNKMLFRTIAVSVMAIFNLGFTIIGVRLYGSIAACIGTVLGLAGANIIAMNIYYAKVIGFNVFRIFSEVFSRTWICLAIPSILLIVLNNMVPRCSWVLFGLKVLIFCVVYFFLMLIFGFSSTERVLIKKLFTK